MIIQVNIINYKQLRIFNNTQPDYNFLTIHNS
jgi:hypothetical protein